MIAGILASTGSAKGLNMADAKLGCEYGADGLCNGLRHCNSHAPVDGGGCRD